MSDEKKDLTEEVQDQTSVESKKKEVKKPAKKKYIVAGRDAYGMYYIGFENGGELPDKLKNSKFTSEAIAEAFVLKLNEGR